MTDKLTKPTLSDLYNSNPRPSLFSNAQYAQLIANGIMAQQKDDFDPMPVVKLFTPSGAATWLLTDIHPGDPDAAFGLCDLGMGEPELGSVSLSELSALRVKLELPVERDRHFIPTKSLAEYAEEARLHGHIVT